MQDAVVARQYINDNGSFQRQARLWTGQWLRRMLRLTTMHARQLELADQWLLCASLHLCAGLYLTEDAQIVAACLITSGMQRALPFACKSLCWDR